MSVVVLGSVKAANDIVAKFQIHQAQRCMQLGRLQQALAAQLHIEPASDWKTLSLNSLDGFERYCRAGKFEGCLPGVQVIQEISGDQTGGRAWCMRRQADFRVRDLHFTVSNR